MIMKLKALSKILAAKALALVLALAAAAPAYSQFKSGVLAELDDSETAAALRSHVVTVSSKMMEGRKAGSEGEKMTAEYLTETLKSYGVDVISGDEGDIFGIRQDGGDTLTSRNVVGFIQGTDKDLNGRYIVIGARMDNLGTDTMTVNGQKVERIYYGANGNASGVAMLAELAKRLQTNRMLLRRSVLIVGFGASCQTYAGAWYFLNRSFSDADRIDAMINLDMVGTGTNGFYAYTSSNADMNEFVTALSRELQPVQPTLTAQEPYPSDHRAFYAKEIPSILFTSGRFSEYGTERDTQSILDFEAMEKELEYVFNFSVALANGSAPVFNPNAAASVKTRGITAWYDCDTKPTFYGSSDPRYFLTKWVYTYMKYPEEAVRNGVQGRVMVSFVINESGKIEDVRVLKSAGELLDAEAVRIVEASPDWKPGKIKGEKVKSEMTLYIEFLLERKGKNKWGWKKN